MLKNETSPVCDEGHAHRADGGEETGSRWRAADRTRMLVITILAAMIIAAVLYGAGAFSRSTG